MAVLWIHGPGADETSADALAAAFGDLGLADLPGQDEGGYQLGGFVVGGDGLGHVLFGGVGDGAGVCVGGGIWGFVDQDHSVGVEPLVVEVSREADVRAPNGDEEGGEGEERDE